jgi:protein-S-isoprenylcysteine O-methyltransferase Ste14
MMHMIPIVAAMLVVALRTWMHAYQPHRLDAGDDRHLDREYSRASMLFKHVASLALMGAMAFVWWRRGIFGRDSLYVHEVLGVLLVGAGVGVRHWAIATLGRFFTFELGLRKEHDLVQGGPYQWVMHPAYTGSLLVEVGVCTFFSAWWVGLPIVASTVAFLRRRIADEEHVLRAEFGDRFDAYARGRARLVPGVY